MTGQGKPPESNFFTVGAFKLKTVMNKKKKKKVCITTVCSCGCNLKKRKQVKLLKNLLKDLRKVLVEIL